MKLLEQVARRRVFIGFGHQPVLNSALTSETRSYDHSIVLSRESQCPRAPDVTAKEIKHQS